MVMAIPSFLKRLRGGTAVSDRSDGRSGLLPAILTNHPTSETGRAVVNVLTGRARSTTPEGAS